MKTRKEFPPEMIAVNDISHSSFKGQNAPEKLPDLRKRGFYTILSFPIQRKKAGFYHQSCTKSGTAPLNPVNDSMFSNGTLLLP